MKRRHNKKKYLFMRKLIGEYVQKLALIVLLLAVAIFIVLYADSLINKPSITGLVIQPNEAQNDPSCKEFEEDVLWSSKYTHNEMGATKYQTWKMKANCMELGKGKCFLKALYVNSRTMYLSPNEANSIGEGYVQISDPNEAICDNPENGVYTRYLLYETIDENDGEKSGWSCGKNKNPGGVCGIEINTGIKEDAGCYGIKVHASKYFLIDVIQVKYKLCWDENNGDGL